MKTFRDFLVSETNNLSIVNNLYKVFRKANIDTSIIMLKKGKPDNVTLIESKGMNDYKLDNQIDKLVYELYRLTEEEIKIVEGVSL
jgi:hypothetical protein